MMKKILVVCFFILILGGVSAGFHRVVGSPYHPDEWDQYSPGVGWLPVEGEKCLWYEGTYYAIPGEAIRREFYFRPPLTDSQADALWTELIIAGHHPYGAPTYNQYASMTNRMLVLEIRVGGGWQKFNIKTVHKKTVEDWQYWAESKGWDGEVGATYYTGGVIESNKFCKSSWPEMYGDKTLQEVRREYLRVSPLAWGVGVIVVLFFLLLVMGCLFLFEV